MKRTIRQVVFVLAVVLVVAFWKYVSGKATSDFYQPVPHEVARAQSPAGWCVAYAVESDFGPGSQNTQVILSFDGGRCGSGAVSFPGLHLGLRLRWLDEATLEVQYPSDVQPTRNASGEVLQCLQRKVRVVLVTSETAAQGPNPALQRTASAGGISFGWQRASSAESVAEL